MAGRRGHAIGVAGLVLVVTTGLTQGAVAAPAQVAPPRSQATVAVGLPLGDANLVEQRSVQRLAPGATLTTVVRGQPSPDEVWTVTAGFFAYRVAAQALATRLVAAGFTPRVEQVDGRAQDDPQQGPVGFVVRIGRSSLESDAQALAARLTAAGFPGGSATSTALDGDPTSGPWVVRILDVDPHRFRGRVRAHLGTDIVPERETVSSLVSRTGALAGVNGGYFVIPPTDGTPGDLAGISVESGRLVSEAVDGRAALTLARGSNRAAVRRLSTVLSVRARDRASHRLGGLNRVPGLVRSCGQPGLVPTSAPKHDVTCTTGDELVLFDRDFGPTASAGPGAQAVLDGQGRVVRLAASRGGAIPIDGAVVEGIGPSAQWLLRHVRVGQVLRRRSSVVDQTGRSVRVRHTDVVNGGPLLVLHGAAYVDAFAEGFVQPDRPSFYYSFAVRRNPRTMAGVTRRGHLLLVTVDGRRPAYSIGMSFREQAAVMRALGASDALNLDGGGSTTLATGQGVLGRPSDDTGERPVGDAVLLLPGRHG